MAALEATARQTQRVVPADPGRSVARPRRLDAVEKNVKKYAAAVDAKAFQIASTLRQFTEIWDLEASDERGRGLVATLRARLLELPGGELEMAPPTSSACAISRRRTPLQLEAVLGTAGAQTYRWWKTGLDRALAVASIRHRLGSRVGTGFSSAPPISGSSRARSYWS